VGYRPGRVLLAVTAPATRTQREAHARERAAILADHAESVRRRAAQPRDLLAWFLQGIRLEMPGDIHTAGVWRDRVSEGEAQVGIRPVGGSLLGTPATEGGFRRFIEGSPYATERAEYEGHADHAVHYATPMRAALARLAGRGPDRDPRVFMARFLYRVAMLGSVDSAAASMGIAGPVVPVYLEAALYQLWRRFETEPRGQGWTGTVAIA
jgi:hypothetical protein